MRGFIVLLLILLGAFAGFVWVEGEDWRLKIAMMGIGILFTAPIAASFSKRKSKKSSRCSADLHLNVQNEQPVHFEKPSTHHPHIPERW
jgi:cyanate permease